MQTAVMIVAGLYLALFGGFATLDSKSNHRWVGTLLLKFLPILLGVLLLAFAFK